MKLSKNLIILFLFAIQISFAQSTGAIKGSVVNSEANALSNVNIEVKGLQIGDETNNRGEFSLKNIPEGNYTIQVSYVGYETQNLKVNVQPGTTTKIPSIILIGKQEQLGTVVLRGNGNGNKFTRNTSVSVAKMPLKKIENPQVYNNITAELLQEQVITNFDDAIKNASGLTKLWESTGRGNDGAGYFSLRGFPVQPTLVNGLPALTNGSPDPANMENIEVIKGPSGTLYGSSLVSYGGLINITTKKPYNYFGGNISYTLGSFGLNRVTADVNTPLDETGDVALRINTAYHTENSFQDAGFNKSLFVAPSLSYKVNDKLSFFVNTEFYDSESTNPLMLFVDRGAPLTATNLEELGYNNENSYTSNDLTVENPTFSLQAQMNYELSDQWTSQTAVSTGSAKALGNYSYLYETTRFKQNREEVPGEVTNLDEGLIFSRYISNQNSTTLSTDIQQNFIGDFEIAGMRNRTVVGLDYFNRRVIDNNTGYIKNGDVYIGNASLQNVNESVFGIYEPANYITDNDSGILSKEATAGLLENVNRNNNIAEEDIYSAYISNVLNFTPQLALMTSLRLDQFETETNSQTALSPKFGVVYQPILDKVALFANYMDGFSNVGPRQVDNLETGESRTLVFDPERAKQFEVGTKFNLLNNHLSATLSYYDIQVSNIVMQDAENPFNLVQDGEQYSRGFEASVTASPIEGLNLIAGFSHNDSELTESDQVDFLGRRPESAGPETLANFWASYRFTQGNLEGFGLGFGGNYASENMIFNRQTAGVFTLPSYTILNASLFYNVDKFGINLKLNNLTNEEYYTGWSTINPQRPRNFAASLTYNF
ncbi:TonB-dependent receptor [Salegentibacter mishustinae]|uniref:TonB-dependent receptor n=1 Tax=Salegentibacter mishustinae TaxID=270918 RepID=A0A0Q9ZAQ4_9FLAO|nr:TonB-dependent receptor [Salegentibacter mishustinae]KRG30095.1 TonB-dependent receptor [Salegentibacter mishustinae]PNW19523.1 TonB-dependent receptor [Salegentibacter mishustinae]PZX62023.1 iron complex outermembrane receptor protein [Salegentibacter mishustinae]GGW95093.1 TonB-dependent receptor [Salegentibacter mishustinae]